MSALSKFAHCPKRICRECAFSSYVVAYALCSIRSCRSVASGPVVVMEFIGPEAADTWKSVVGDAPGYLSAGSGDAHCSPTPSSHSSLCAFFQYSVGVSGPYALCERISTHYFLISKRRLQFARHVFSD